MQDRFQFSLRSLLLLTALVAASLTPFLSTVSIASLSARIAVAGFLASLAIIASASTSGINRAFWIGVAFPVRLSAFNGVFFLTSLGAYWNGTGTPTDYFEALDLLGG
jgi:hypothetical protein